MKLLRSTLALALLAALVFGGGASATLFKWSETAAPNANIDSTINWAEGQSPSSVNDSARAMMAAIAKFRDDTSGRAITGGSAPSYTVTSSQGYTSLTAMNGAHMAVRFHAVNVGHDTLNVDGLGAKALQLASGTAISTGSILANSVWSLTYVNSIPAWLVHGVSGAVAVTTIDIAGATQLTTIATNDSLPIYDLSATTNKRITVNDALKVINLLVEDTNPDSAADFVMTYDTSAGDAKKVALQNLRLALPRGYIDGCILSNNVSDLTNDIDIGDGVARDSTNTANLTCSSVSGKQLDADWSPSGTGFRNSAAGITNATYHIWLASKADGTSTYYAHTSATAATVLTALNAEGLKTGANYLYARMIGSIVRGGGSIFRFTQLGDLFEWYSLTLDTNVTATAGANATGTASVPTGIRVRALMNIEYEGTAGIYISPNTSTAQNVSTTAAPLVSMYDGGNSNGGQVWVTTDTSGQFRYQAGNSVAFRVATVSYIHPRGRDQ